MVCDVADPCSVEHAAKVGILAAESAELAQAGLDPIDVGALVLDAICDDELYVFTHCDGSWRGDIEARFAAILLALDRAATRCAESSEDDRPTN